MSIQYTVPGFEPTTLGTLVSSHNHQTRARISFWFLHHSFVGPYLYTVSGNRTIGSLDGLRRLGPPLLLLPKMVSFSKGRRRREKEIFRRFLIYFFISSDGKKFRRTAQKIVENLSELIFIFFIYSSFFATDEFAFVALLECNV